MYPDYIKGVFHWALRYVRVSLPPSPLALSLHTPLPDDDVSTRLAVSTLNTYEHLQSLVGGYRKGYR